MYNILYSIYIILYILLLGYIIYMYIIIRICHDARSHERKILTREFV